jgi:hypothetical protein
MGDFFKYRVMRHCIIIGLTMFSYSAIAQPSEKDIQLDILRLREYSIEYHKYLKRNDPAVVEIKSARKKKYLNQIDKIKNGPNRTLYIEFLDHAIDQDSLKHNNQTWYNYTTPGLDYSARTSPTRLEYFKVVKYSLFTLDKDELLMPLKVPFLKGKKY